MSYLLQVENLHTYFFVRKGVARAVNGLNLTVKQGELLGLIGESGSGKTVTAMSIVGRVREPGRIVDGKVIYQGTDLRILSEDELRKYRGKEIALIAANARAHLNPLIRVGDQIANVYLAHSGGSKLQARRVAVEMLRSVGINDAERRAESYPHELSGGMAQRVMIAQALVNSPRLLIADDATNGLDVTVQAQIMDLILDMVSNTGSSGIFITHDLGIVAQCCSEVAIMYCGQIVEKAPVGSFFEGPQHPYSVSLINSLPERRAHWSKGLMRGTLPSALDLPTGCLFHPRCPRANDRCRHEEPPMINTTEGCYVKCHEAVTACETGGLRK